MCARDYKWLISKRIINVPTYSDAWIKQIQEELILVESLFMKLSRKKLKPGQVFRLYIGDNIYIFIRNIFIIPKSFYLVEIFNYKSTDGVFQRIGVLTA